ncbi:MAG: aminoacyl-tRNA hydrolase [Thermoleophilia bacterium]
MSPEDVAAHLAAAGTWTWSRASGPGGQRRDHAETRAELTLRARDLEDLPHPVAARLRDAFGLARRPLRLTSQADRSRERNREIVVARLTERVAEALAPAPPPRRPTRPTRASKERRLADKARRSGVKAGRKAPAED